jgi:NAD(P)-dependent dehydrogenase (short-subunit alcohol dehydrogenase family)
MQFKANSFVQGASRGIGLELVRQLLETREGLRVFASCRRPDEATGLQELQAQHGRRLVVLSVDVTEESSISHAATRVSDEAGELSLLVNVAGVLHGPGFGPEKRLAQIQPEALRHAFEVNAFGPLLVAKHFSQLLRHPRRAVLANLSARVGSISDNRLGGWYAYRGSKAAQNMFTKTLSIELGRIAPNAIVVGLHPGTVDTALSKPFQRNVPAKQLQSPRTAVSALLGVIDAVTANDTGKVFDFRGAEIAP